MKYRGIDFDPQPDGSMKVTAVTRDASGHAAGIYEETIPAAVWRKLAGQEAPKGKR